MKIGIIGAMDEEINLVKSKLRDVTSCCIAKQEFFVGTMVGHQVTLLRCGVGKVSASVGTTLLNNIFKPDYIINIGSAGALGFTLNIGDVIIASEIRYHDVDLTAFGYSFGQMSKMPVCFCPDQKLVTLIKENYSEFGDLTVKDALLVSGDSFVSTKEQIDHIKKHFSDNCVVDMEACAIAQVCHLFEVPFIIIRAISDITEKEHNKNTHENFLSLSAERAATVALRLLHVLSNKK